MISYINGTIKNLEINQVIILTNFGIGYEIIINELIYSHIINKKEAELFVYHNITENGQNLFGFLSFEDREFFKELIKISGVGGKVAQNIMSLGVSKLKIAIYEDDKKLIESIKGVGKKMSEKIILELKDKDFIKNINLQKEIKQKQVNIEKTTKDEIMSTLTIMGYNPKRVEELLQTLPTDYDTIQKIIPFIIKNI
ncbi:Holliday junction branch migration protein RuvA [Candidatus Gracilibacteria bacterium]|nr:Holliday junction branch migration protein RuvA [Candidatus Gracilibacteria bacterium]